MSRIEQALRRASQAAPENDPQKRGAVARISEIERPSPVPDLLEFRHQDERTRTPVSIPRFQAPEPEIPEEAAGVLAALEAEKSEKLVTSGQVAQGAVEQYRKLAVTLHQLQMERGTKTVMVASAMPAEGKTLTAANIALTLSESLHRRVLLIDADLRRPTIHDIFRISNATGLSEVLSIDEEQKLAPVQVSQHLSVLPAGQPNGNPMRGLSSDRMRRIIEEASARFDWVVIDTPPVGLLPDANLLAKMVDTVVLVIAAGITPFRLVERAVAAIDRKRIVGVVLNRAVQSQLASSYYHYNYAARPASK